MTGGRFSDGARAAAFQQLFNDAIGALLHQGQESAVQQQAKEAGMQKAVADTKKYDKAYVHEFESNQQLPSLQKWDPLRSVDDLFVMGVREGAFTGYEHYGEVLLEDGDAFGHVLTIGAKGGSYFFGGIESGAFGLDAGDAIYSSYSASQESGINPVYDWSYIANFGN